MRLFPNLGRVALSSYPTDIHEMPRLREALGGGPRLLIKRDDQTSLALGGNKVRKLEFLLAAARASACEVVLTAGGVQSNHCRLTAAAAVKMGMECHLILGGEGTAPPAGNALLDGLCGAHLHYVPAAERAARMDELAEALARQGRNPYVIPVGGSNGLGALGYAEAMLELKQQWEGDWNAIHTMVFATSSGGTQAGLALGARLLDFQGALLGISIDQPLDRRPKSFQDELAGIANQAAELAGESLRLGGGDFQFNADYLGAGYGVLGPPEKEAIHLLARTEAIFLDPVYTGRAMAGLIDLIRRGRFDDGENVLFWHTGGSPALFAYAPELTENDTV